MGTCVSANSANKVVSIKIDNTNSRETEHSPADKRYSSNPNRKILLDYYAAARSQMHRKIKQLFEIIFSGDHLDTKEINLNFTKIDVVSIYHLKTVLQYFENLKSLCLWKTGIVSRDLKRLSKSFETLTKLETLNIQGNNIDTEGGKYLSGILRKTKQLKVLYLSENQLGYEGCISFAPCLRSISNLEQLALDENKIQDEGLAALVPNLLAMTNLKYLGLRYNDLTANSKNNLELLVTSLANLKTIGLRDNEVPDSVIQVIKFRAPKIEFL
ncbi:unnamed protein product [Blepharisma stoltei]|uniref:Uncharacterized protein n=1 Tax=Blepharisma stoltei TaxID=1481888 RepID=A0AAU9IIQ0_9CILI|nr:unnamed protein product [Blepharisma stoltei]